MRYLSLFSGCCGGDLGLQHLLNPKWECMGYVEWEEYCQKLIRQRQKDGFLTEAPIFSDIREFVSQGYAESYKGLVDCVTGGFPCTDISIANSAGCGLDGERSGLWRDMAKVISMVGARYVFIENSPAITFRGLREVLSDLARMGYDAKWMCFRASALGAFHGRKRFWLVANSVNERLQGRNKPASGAKWEIENPSIQTLVQNITWPDVSDPNAYGSNDGLPDRVDRTKAIGNAQVPIVAATAWRVLSGE